MKHYFVTGATGAIGSALIPLLLEESENRVWILMRSESRKLLHQRLDKLIVFWDFGDAQAEDARKRIVPVQGDMSAPRFGINPEQYEEITKDCTHIIHCAGVVRMNLPMQEARRHAVDSAENVVNLALACKAAGNLSKIEYVSTVGVGGTMAEDVPEAWITRQRDFHNTYEASKAEAEDYLHEQAEKHELPVSVHRPSMVVGDSRTGKIIHFQIFYHLCEFLSGRRTMGISPALENARLDMVPVDYVAEAIRWSACNDQTSGKIFHLCSGPEDSIELKDLRKYARERFAEKGLALPPVITLPTAAFMFLMKIISLFLDEKSKRAVKTLPVILDYLADRKAFLNMDTLSFFKANNGPVLPARQEYLNHVLEYYLESAARHPDRSRQ